MTQETLLPQNRTAFEEAADLTGARIADLPLDIPTLIRPFEMPSAFLPWAAWGLSVLKGLHLRHIGGGRCPDRDTRWDTRRLLAHEDEAGLDRVCHPILKQDAIGHVRSGLQWCRVALDDDALQQIFGAAVALLLGEQLARNAATPVGRVHPRVTRVVHTPGLTIDVERAP